MRWLALALLTACGGLRAPDYVSTAGAEYRFEGTAPWLPDQIEAQEQGFLKALPPGYEQAGKAMKLAQVFVYPSKLQCGTGWCNGLEDYQELSVVDLGCPAKSALTHEMAHLLQWDLKGVTDYDHTETLLWTVADAQYPGGCQ